MDRRVFDQGTDFILVGTILIHPSGFIERSPFHKEVLFELSKNQPVYQVPDSEAASLQLAINYILSVPEQDRHQKVREASSSESHMLQGMPSDFRVCSRTPRSSWRS